MHGNVSDRHETLMMTSFFIFILSYQYRFINAVCPNQMAVHLCFQEREVKTSKYCTISI